MDSEFSALRQDGLNIEVTSIRHMRTLGLNARENGSRDVRSIVAGLNQLWRIDPIPSPPIPCLRFASPLTGCGAKLGAEWFARPFS